MRIVEHGHHNVLFIYFPDDAAVAARRRVIETRKPEEECALRLALLRDVTDLLPRNAEWAACERALAAYKQTWTAYAQAQAAYEQARAAFEASFDVEAFHAAHCHPRCPWDGTTIFARGKGVEVLG